MKIFVFLLVVTVCAIEAEPYNPTSGKRPTLIQYPPQEVFVQAAKDTYLNCTFINTIDTGIHWFKDNKHIVSDKKGFTINRQDTETGTQSHLVIDQGTAIGSYYCEAENKYGSIASHKVHLKAAYFSGPDRPYYLGKYTIPAGHHWTRLCAKVISKPKPIFSWFKRPATKGNKRENGKKVANSLRTLVTEDGRLMIASLRKTDEGRYECKAFNNKTRHNKNVATVDLDIEGGKVIGSPLEILYPNETNSVISVIKGQRMEVHIQALFASRYDMRVDWFKNGIPLPEFQNKSDIAVNTMPDDAGIYTAVAIVIGGENRQKRVDIRLDVQVPPVIQQGPVNRNVSANETGLFAICDASGNPIPTIEWTEGFEIDGKRTKKVDFGKYLPLPQHKAGTILTLSCNASNDAGYQIAEAIIQYTHDVPSGDDEDRIVPNPHFPSASSFNKSTRLLGDFPSILVGLLLPGVWQYR